MDPRLILTAVIAALTTLLGAHLLLLLAFGAAVLVVAVLAFGIASVTLDSGWRVVPGVRLR